MLQKTRFPVRFLVFSLLFSSVLSLFSLPSLMCALPLPAEETDALPQYTVVIDAGHGGEDGGAVSASGICEKEINLSIALTLKELLEADGIPVVLTRSEDVLLYDRNADYQGRKKALDLAARKRIAEETPDALFISIHLNSFPDARYHGLQVWYSPNHPASALLAEQVQTLCRTDFQPENGRETKAAGSSIYLLRHLECPAILVECGFLSNPGEAGLLADGDYQKDLAFLIFLSVLKFREENRGEISRIS